MNHEFLYILANLRASIFFLLFAFLILSFFSSSHRPSFPHPCKIVIKFTADGFDRVVKQFERRAKEFNPACDF